MLCPKLLLILCQQPQKFKVLTGQVKYCKNTYPLIDRNLSRKDCYKIITDLGYPIPNKSGCDFCMYNKRSHFKKLSINHPERFKQIVEMEQNSKSYTKGYNDFIKKMKNCSGRLCGIIILISS